jgi:hypothetical protein
MDTDKMLRPNTQRPAWTSETSTGMFHSYHHQHGRSVRVNYYVESAGFGKISDESEIFS